MKEYLLENGTAADLHRLRSSRLPLEQYQPAHQSLVQACHDVVIEYQGSTLLVTRTNFPAKDHLYVPGGRIERGMPAEESLRMRVKAECNLDLYDIRPLGCARTFFRTDPFGHGKGTDTLNLLFFARGEGELRLDDLHEKPTLIHPTDYTPAFRSTLDEYVRDLLDMTMPIVVSLAF
jgi:ADP-ribose pyrophosphatase YjhB (NUDIX family)